MAEGEINEYLVTATEVKALSFFDIDQYISAGIYQSQKVPLSVLQSALGGGGAFGISDATGTYTYYDTLTLAMAAAVSGEVIQVFADFVETGAVTITFKDGVSINGNGYTYTLNNSGTINAFEYLSSGNLSFNIHNFNVIRTGSITNNTTQNCVVRLTTATSGNIDLTGSTFTNSGSGAGFALVTKIHLTNGRAYSSSVWGAFAIFSFNVEAKLTDCKGFATGAGFGIRCHSGGQIENCYGEADSGYGIFGTGIHSNCTGVSITGYGYQTTGKAYNCVGKSTSGNGFDITNATEVVGCTGISVSGVGFRHSNKTTYNCTGISSSNVGYYMAAQAVTAYNLMSKSTSNRSMNTSINQSIYGGLIISEWNDFAGFGIYGTYNVATVILNCTFILANSSAPYLQIFTNAAQAVSTRGNTYKGGGAFNPNITQAIVTTEDSQGNIFL